MAIRSFRLAVALPCLAACAPRATADAPAPPTVPAQAAAPVCEEPTAQEDDKGSIAAYLAEHYTKREVQIPVRDGKKLFTAIYAPRDTSQTYPFLMLRTPYSIGPYGEEMRTSLAPTRAMLEDGYIFVYQDVRGRFMSEGTYRHMTPHVADKSGPNDVDESTDTYDTVEWLVNNVENNNGKVGQWGISYPGFYSSAGMIDAHPALVAVSPQAPIADFFFDDFHHHGAFFLPHAFNFLQFFLPQAERTTEWGERFDYGTKDGYDFYGDFGPLKNATARFGENNYWHDMVKHPNYDDFWQSRNILPHLKNVAPAVMTVGGWFDAEDLYGPLNTYRSVEEKNPDVFNILVMGPWRHGGWNREDGDHLGNAHFGAKTSLYFQHEIQARFFEHFLKGKGEMTLPEAYVFETGANRWRQFASWPPAGLEKHRYYLAEGGALKKDVAPTARKAADQFVSDPANPVPFTEVDATGMTREYMTDDQRFASRRPDVLVYETDVLTEDVTLAGPLLANLWVATSQQDADWVVKVIDVFPGDAPDHEFLADGRHMSNYHMMVRSEVIRGRFRESYETPKPFRSNKPTQVDLKLQDLFHTFQAGHRIQIQIQSTWFPLVDRNPQKWVANIFEAEASDFVPATHTVYRSAKHPTSIEVGILPAKK